MHVKGKRTLKNGAVAGYVYYPKDKKWKWRIIGGARKTPVSQGRHQLANSTENNELRNTYSPLGKELVKLKYDLLQKHKSSPKVMGKHNNKDYYAMYNFLNRRLRGRNVDYEQVARDFLESGEGLRISRNTFQTRIRRSLNKWLNKNCRGERKCEKQKVASRLLRNRVGEVQKKLKSNNIATRLERLRTPMTRTTTNNSTNNGTRRRATNNGTKRRATNTRPNNGTGRRATNNSTNNGTRKRATNNSTNNGTRRRTTPQGVVRHVRGNVNARANLRNGQFIKVDNILPVLLENIRGLRCMNTRLTLDNFRENLGELTTNQIYRKTNIPRLITNKVYNPDIERLMTYTWALVVDKISGRIERNTNTQTLSTIENPDDYRISLKLNHYKDGQEETCDHYCLFLMNNEQTNYRNNGCFIVGGEMRIINSGTNIEVHLSDESSKLGGMNEELISKSKTNKRKSDTKNLLIILGQGIARNISHSTGKRVLLYVYHRVHLTSSGVKETHNDTKLMYDPRSDRFVPTDVPNKSNRKRKGHFH